MSLLRQDAFDEISKHALNYAGRIDEAFSLAQYGADGSGTPPGMKRLDTPDEQATWQRFLETQARREQEGFAPGDVASAATQHPAVVEAFAEDPDAAS